MSRYNPQWEDQIKNHRRNRVLLVAKNLPFRATPTEVEATIRARLTKPDSVTFLWPPGATGPNRHISWVMLAFSSRPNTKMGLEELQNFEILGRAVKVERASKKAYTPSSSARTTAARNSASATPAAPPAAPPTAATITATTTTTTTTTTTAASAATTAATPAHNPSDSLEETPLPSQGVGEWIGRSNKVMDANVVISPNVVLGESLDDEIQVDWDEEEE